MIPVLTNKTGLSNIDISSGFIILIHKEQNWTSFDVVKKLRNVLKVKKVGHGGTLDPFATGLMLIGAGKGTKALTELSGLSKQYRAKIRFGIVTDTYDRTGEVIEENETGPLTLKGVERAVETFKGEIMQQPPMYSAKKVNGVRLYKLARKNIEVERQPQAVQIYDAQILDWQNPYLLIDLNVSKGTYIRSYAYDLGKTLGVGGCLEELERTAIDRYKLEDSFTVSKFIAAFKEVNENNPRT